MRYHTAKRCRSQTRSAHKKFAKRDRAHGFFLVDVLIYVALLGLIMTFALSAFLKALSASRDLKRNAAHVTAALRAGEQWRGDLRAAVSRPTVIVQGAETAFEIPTATGMAVYLFHNGAVWRRSNPESPWDALIENVKASRIERDARQHVATWTWQIELKPRKQVVRIPPRFRFVAVARGDSTP